jgi:HK97 family phage portal protein
MVYIPLVDTLQRMLKSTKLQKRALDSFVDHPGLTEQLLAIQGLSSTSWYPPSIKEALSVPAVFRAVTMIANLVGSLTMQAWRNGVLLTGQQVPILVSRPGVFSTPRDFFRDTAYCLASRGEYIWWVVDRDDDGLAKKLLILPPGEVTVRWNEQLPLVREYEWRNKQIPADDIEHGTFSREPGALRGQGPLQICGAALSAAVEADEWAARFFKRGGVPSVVLESVTNLSSAEANKLKEQWLEAEGNEVRVASGGAKPTPFQINPENAQLLESRKYSAAAVATMFGMDADLLNAAVSGSSLTYQNVGQRLDNFIRTTLGPNYLEPIEHGISERLSRTTVARFALQTLHKADVATQASVYSTLVAAGVDATRAAEIAGLDSLVDTIPIPAPEPLRIEVPV